MRFIGDEYVYMYSQVISSLETHSVQNRTSQAIMLLKVLLIKACRKILCHWGQVMLLICIPLSGVILHVCYLCNCTIDVDEHDKYSTTLIIRGMTNVLRVVARFWTSHVSPLLCKR